MPQFETMIEVFKMPTGRVQYDVFHRGDLIERVDQSNLIVTQAKNIMARLLSGASGYSIAKIGFGTNASLPSLGNTALTDAFVKNLGTATVSANQVTFPFTLLSGEANGKNLSEMGLFTQGDLLYSRLTRITPLVKTSEIALAGNWIITF